MKGSPSFALKMATSSGFLLVLWPYVWRFGWDYLVVLFGVLAIVGVWGLIYNRDNKKSRVEQDWELFGMGFYFLASGLGILSLRRFPIVERSLPPSWIAAALVASVVLCFFVFRSALPKSGCFERVLTLVVGPLLAFTVALSVLNYFNGVLDFQTPRVFTVEIKGKLLEQSKYSRGPLLEIVYWHDARETEEVSVPYTDYVAAEVGKMALVHVSPGFLGAEWVEGTEVK